MDHVRSDPAGTGRLRPRRTELAVFTTFAAVHLPGLVVALGRPAWAPLGSVAVSFLLWTALAVLAVRALRREAAVPQGLVAAALALDAVVLTLSGLSPPRPGNLVAAAVGMIAICAASALLTRPRHVPLVVLPAVVGQAVLVHAADTAADTARYAADTATALAATVATSAVIVWLEHSRRSGVRALAEAATTDPLTRLLNRRGLQERFGALQRRSAARGEVVAVVVADVDAFKAVNDSFGHDVGDAVLVAVADALRAGARSGDLLVRLGGEELAWVAPWPAADAAVGAAERLRSRVAAATAGAGRPVTVSAGVAVLDPRGPGDGDPTGDPADGPAVLSRLLVAADRALYAAKAAGRDRVVVADPVAHG